MIALLLTLSACSNGELITDSAVQDSEEDPDPVPNYASYEAELVWELDTLVDSWDCTDTTIEYGVEVTDEVTVTGLKSACPLCQHFYIATQDAPPCEGKIPGVPDSDYRGIVMGEGAAQLYRFDYSDGAYEEVLLDNAAAFDEWTLSFETMPVDGWLTDLTVSGTWVFEEMAAQ